MSGNNIDRFDLAHALRCEITIKADQPASTERSSTMGEESLQVSDTGLH